MGIDCERGHELGRAVIVSDDVGCQPDLVNDGVEGCVFPVGDVTALTEALRRVLERQETAAIMGQQGLERISEWSYEEDIARASTSNRGRDTEVVDVITT